MSKNEKRIRLASPSRYSMGMFGLTIPTQMYTAYFTFFYADIMGLSMKMVSLGVVFYSIWDAFNDPLMGFLSDRTRTKAGRRRPWLLIGAPLYALFFTLFFSPPGAIQKSETMMTVYFTVLLMLTETMNTITSVNYHALFPELFRTVLERTQANALRQGLQLVGMIIGVSLTPMIADALGYSTTAMLLGLLGMGLLVFCALGCKEDPKYYSSDSPGLIESLKAVVKNRNFWTLGTTNFFYGATTGLALAGIPFFVKYTLGKPDKDATYLSAAVFLLAIPAVWGWSYLARRWGALKAWRTAQMFLCASFVPMFFANNMVMAMIAGAFVGIGIAGVTATMDLISARIIDEDALVSGLRREGIYQSTISFVTRFSGLIRSGVFALIFVFFGFSSGKDPGPMPDQAARWMMSVFPFVLMVLAAIASHLVRFNPKLTEQIEKQLAER